PARRRVEPDARAAAAERLAVADDVWPDVVAVLGDVGEDAAPLARAAEDVQQRVELSDELLALAVQVLVDQRDPGRQQRRGGARAADGLPGVAVVRVDALGLRGAVGRVAG